MKLDASLGVESSPKSAAQAARAAEEMGFAGLWSNETKHDGFLPLALAASATERIELGTSVAIAFSRSPMEVAQTAWDLQDLSGGRFILGLGTQVKAHVTRRFSMPWERPVERFGEYIRALRAIWRSFQTDEPLRFEGEFYRHTLITPFFNPGPIEHPDIPIYIAGVNERLCRLAGELCDGFHVHPFHSPEYVRKTVLPAIEEGAAKAGRDADEVELATSVFVVTGRDAAETEKAREQMRSQISFYASTPTYRTVLEAHGWEEVGERLGVMAREKRWSEMPGLVTGEMMRAFCVEAAPEEVGAALRERYEGLIGRVALYAPFVPGERDAFWRTVVESLT
ncbi:MAG: LLM class F420-dependent oxidoreductase [Actinomycetota bacterium]